MFVLYLAWYQAQNAWVGFPSGTTSARFFAGVRGALEANMPAPGK